MKFNVLNDPWITVRMSDGQIRKMGIRDVLANAHLAKEITDGSPLYEYGIYRLLFVFLMEIYKPCVNEDIEDILDTERIDISLFETYVRKMENANVSFDIFDEQHPFLQVPRCCWDDSESTKPVSLLDVRLPSGNNHVHFYHVFEENMHMYPEEAAKALCSINVFCTAIGAKGYPSTVNGAPPIYCIVKGENLFQTLVYGMVPASKYEKYDNPPVIWANKDPIIAKKKVASTSLLHALTFPCRRILLIPEIDGTIKEMYFSQGMDFNGYQSFRDPYVGYKRTKDGNTSIKPSMDKESWRDIGSILDCVHDYAPYVVKQYADITDNNVLNAILYETVTNNAAYNDARRSVINVPLEILKSPIKLEYLQVSIQMIEKGSYNLRECIDQFKKMINRGKRSEFLVSEKESIMQRYFWDARQLFWEEMLLMIQNQDLKELKNHWEKEIKDLVMQMFNEFLELTGQSATHILAAERIKSSMILRRNL